MKTCTKCGEEKLANSEFFPIRNNGKDGLDAQCKLCKRIAGKAHYIRFKETYKRCAKSWSARNKEKIKNKRYHMRSNARHRGYAPVDLSAEEINTILGAHSGVCDMPSCVRRAEHVDHDHATGAYRGYLCIKHNTGLGQFGDSIIELLEGVEYLRGTA